MKNRPGTQQNDEALTGLVSFAASTRTIWSGCSHASILCNVPVNLNLHLGYPLALPRRW